MFCVLDLYATINIESSVHGMTYTFSKGEITESGESSVSELLVGDGGSGLA
jgi:hypothetical protein